MKEERLIGNVGLQELRQQCLDLLEEIRQTAGVLNDYFEVTENIEYIDVLLDDNKQLLMGARRDGTIYIPFLYCPSLNKSLEDYKEYIEGRINYLNEYFSEAVDAEWIRVITDSEGKILEGITAKGEKVSNLDLKVKGLVSCARLSIDGVSIENSNNVEGFVEVTLDGDGKIVSARKTDGTKVEKVGLETPKVHLGVVVVEGSTSKEDKMMLLLDAENKILSYRDSSGLLHENAGIATPFINLGGTKITKDDILKGSTGTVTFREFDLPKYGSVDISKEISFTSGANSYTPDKISKVDSKYYVTASLVDGQVTEDSIEVTYVESDIDITTWPVSTKTKHYCKVDVDFGAYRKGTFYIIVKFQGDSTMSYPKKNLRFNWYKDVLFSKKDKFKLGELIKTDKFNLKAYWLDKSLLREPACYRLIQLIRETHPFAKQYPWNSKYGVFTGATGIAQNFPVRVDVSGEFYGIHWFGLAKDIKNFMLDDETMNGILLQGDYGNAEPDFWDTLHTEMWDDLLLDEDNTVGPDALPHFEEFYDFINSRNGMEFNKEQAPLHMDVDNWIDSIIIFELFAARDSFAKNLILYTGEDKTIFSPMYYDLDYTWCSSSATQSVLVQTIAINKKIWVNFTNLYWNEICDRYKELRSSLLREDSLKEFLINLFRSVEYSDYEKEFEKWGEHGGGTMAQHIQWIYTRLNWLDSYFIHR